MKKAFLLGLALLGLASCNQRPTSEQLLNQAKESSRIYTSEYQVSKVIIHEDDKRVAGKLLGMNIDLGIAGTDRLIAIPMQGVLKGYVDMGDLLPEDIQMAEDRVSVCLPQPRVMLVSTTINHSSIVESVSLFRSAFSDAELTQIQQQGRDSLLASVPRLGILPQVKKNAERTIVSLLQAFGYTKEQITVSFKNDKPCNTAADVKSILTDATLNN